MGSIFMSLSYKSLNAFKLFSVTGRIIFALHIYSAVSAGNTLDFAFAEGIKCTLALTNFILIKFIDTFSHLPFATAKGTCVTFTFARVFLGRFIVTFSICATILTAFELKLVILAFHDHLTAVLTFSCPFRAIDCVGFIITLSIGATKFATNLCLFTINTT